jgi:hypothetical protein
VFVAPSVALVSPSATVGYYSNMPADLQEVEAAYSRVSWSAGLFYGVADRWRVGGMYSSRSAVHQVGAADYERPARHELSAMIVAMLLLSTDPTSTPTLVGLFRRMELGIGGGGTLALGRIESYLVSPLSSDSSQHFSATSQSMGPMAIASLDLYVSELFSLNAMLRATYIPQETVDKRDLAHVMGSAYLFKTHDPYTLPPLTVDFLAGVQFHF